MSGHEEQGPDPGDEDLTLLLLQKVWQGKLPSRISLAANESKSFTNSPPLYVRIPPLFAIQTLIIPAATTPANPLFTMFP